MKVTFHHPLKTANSLIEFDPSSPSHYPPVGEEGVYIYGIRVKVDGVLMFIPIVVGEGNLRKRLYNDHYIGKFAAPLAILLGDKKVKSGDAKELWDFSKSDLAVSELSSIYQDIDNYDKALGKRGKLSRVAHLVHLIFFQDSDFFNLKHWLESVGNNHNVKIEQSIDYLIKLHSSPSTSTIEHITRIITALSNFKQNFYYVFASTQNNAEIDLGNRVLRESIEKQTKKQLKSIGLYTTADGRKGAEISIKLDLNKIKDELANLGGHEYNDRFGNYINPLIIK